MTSETFLSLCHLVNMRTSMCVVFLSSSSKKAEESSSDLEETQRDKMDDVWRANQSYQQYEEFRVSPFFWSKCLVESVVSTVIQFSQEKTYNKTKRGEEEA